jgi:hypothetical protein
MRDDTARFGLAPFDAARLDSASFKSAWAKRSTRADGGSGTGAVALSRTSIARKSSHDPTIGCIAVQPVGSLTCQLDRPTSPSRQKISKQPVTLKSGRIHPGRTPADAAARRLRGRGPGRMGAGFHLAANRVPGQRADPARGRRRDRRAQRPVVVDLDRVGDTSAASIPLALSHDQQEAGARHLAPSRLARPPPSISSEAKMST